MRINWDEQALEAFADAIAYIAADSYAAASKVAADVAEAIVKAAQHPYANPPDRYRLDKDESFRAFTIYSYRISYRIEPDELIVVRFRHIRQEPLDY